MPIWKQESTIEQLNFKCKNTMAEALDMHFSAIGEDFLEIKMPVNKRTHQPYGLLHGGASAALAETVGSVASALCINADQLCVGIEINCNHIRGIKDGIVTAIAKPLHLGASTHVWDIKITDDKKQLICISRLTVAILKNTQKTAS